MTMDCPLCTSSMHPFQEAALNLDTCPKGHGIWFDGGEISRYKNLVPSEEQPKNLSDETFTPLPGSPVKRCPQCTTFTLEGGHLYGKDVRHCFTCHGVFIGHPLPIIQESMNPTPVLIVGTILEQIIFGFG